MSVEIVEYYDEICKFPVPSTFKFQNIGINIEFLCMYYKIEK